MKKWMWALVAVSTGCSTPPAEEPAAKTPVRERPAAVTKTPAAPKDPSQWNVVDVALSSKDHTTLVAAVTAAGLAESLASPGGVYTIFAPTNAAFSKLPAGTVEKLMEPENRGELTRVLKHHAAVPIVATSGMTDGRTLAMADGSTVTFKVKAGKVFVNEAQILASIPATNGVVHVIDAVLLPPSLADH